MMTMMKLQAGRPADVTGRLDKEVRVYDLLDELGIEYQRIDHEEANTMEICAEIDQVLGATICKNLFMCNRQQLLQHMDAFSDSFAALRTMLEEGNVEGMRESMRRSTARRMLFDKKEN